MSTSTQNGCPVPEALRQVNSLVLKTRPPRRARVVLFQCLGLCFLGVVWRFGLYRQELNFKFVYLLGVWTVILCAVIYSLVRELSRTETITLNTRELTVVTDLLGWEKSRVFDLQPLESVALLPEGYWQGTTYIVSDGKIRFKYLGKDVEIGAGLSHSDAEDLFFRINAQRDFVIREEDQRLRPKADL